MKALPETPRMVTDHIRARLLREMDNIQYPVIGGNKKKAAASVLFLLGMHRTDVGKPPEICFIFNQRSRRVRQPGDLCFPGGGLSPRVDALLACFLKFPGLPLFRWPPRIGRNQIRPETPRGMTRLLATSLRESFEEIRLNPLRITFLGPMAPVHFNLFDRIIFPMIAWTHEQDHFNLNWEVERIVWIPLRHFFRPESYGRFRVSHSSTEFNKTPNATTEEEFPCITYRNGRSHDLLWGLTYRMVMRFLDIVFDFRPPDMASLPVVSKK